MADRGRQTQTQEQTAMLRWALIFLIVALVAGIFGFWGLEGLAMQIAKVLFVVFLTLHPTRSLRRKPLRTFGAERFFKLNMHVLRREEEERLAGRINMPRHRVVAAGWAELSL